MDMPICRSFQKNEAGPWLEERNKVQVMLGVWDLRRDMEGREASGSVAFSQAFSSQERACWGGLQVAPGSFVPNAHLEGFLYCYVISCFKFFMGSPCHYCDMGRQVSG